MACKQCEEWRKLYEIMRQERDRHKEVARELSLKLAAIESGDDHK